ncbi:hypothetical protein JCM16777_2176 [Leptotrichia wadei]|nr:hypothetical protein JCM16777_2176 [Leptotrichia wadei]
MKYKRKNFLNEEEENEDEVTQADIDKLITPCGENG